MRDQMRVADWCKMSCVEATRFGVVEMFDRAIAVFLRLQNLSQLIENLDWVFWNIYSGKSFGKRYTLIIYENLVHKM